MGDDTGSPLDLSSGAGQGALSGLLQAGMGAVSGNPLAIASGVLGLGMSIFGGVSQADAANQKAAIYKQKADATKNIASIQIQQDAVRQQVMETSARRQNMEILRNQQRARAMALSNANSQGAQFGSGLSGGYGQISGQSGVNQLGVTQNLEAGQNMFGLNTRINQQKMNIADYESQLSGVDAKSATAGAIAKIGTSLMGSFTPIKNLSGNFAGDSGTGFTMGMGGGSSSTAIS